MTDAICLLITLFFPEDQLVRCAIKFWPENLPLGVDAEEVVEYHMEPECKEVLYGLLPSHFRQDGTIVEVQEIFDVHIVEGEGGNDEM